MWPQGGAAEARSRASRAEQGNGAVFVVRKHVSAKLTVHPSQFEMSKPKGQKPGSGYNSLAVNVLLSACFAANHHLLRYSLARIKGLHTARRCRLHSWLIVPQLFVCAPQCSCPCFNTVWKPLHRPSGLWVCCDGQHQVVSQPSEGQALKACHSCRLATWRSLQAVAKPSPVACVLGSV